MSLNRDDGPGPAFRVRAESAADHAAVARVIESAFGRPDEARLVEALRGAPEFLPELSLVAAVGDDLVGHALFTRVTIENDGGTHAALALAPLAVRPDWQRRGVGSALVRRGLLEARGLGHGVVIVLGHPAYYPRFGFVPAPPLGIRAPFPTSAGAFQALALRDGALRGVSGVVRYARAFADP